MIMDNKPMYDYNIYRVELKKVEALKSFLIEREFKNINLKNEQIKDSCGFNYELIFCDKRNNDGSPWINLLSSCSELDLKDELKIYGAALICRSKKNCFVITYGNAHFYMNRFCDYNFGIDIAQRILNPDEVKAQQNVSHGTKTSKMQIDYLDAATLKYKGGEIPTFIKGYSTNPDIWGTYVKCGISVQFKWEERPLEIGKKLLEIEKILTRNYKYLIPKLIYLKEEEEPDKIDELFYKLAEAIDQYEDCPYKESYINIPSFYLVGTNNIENDCVGFKITCKGKRKEYIDDFSISYIKNFMDEKSLDLKENIKKINLSIQYGNSQWTPLKPLTSYLEFITDDNYCLRNGKWCKFNKAYINQIFRDVRRVKFISHKNDDLWSVSKNYLINFAKENNLPVNEKRPQIETFYIKRFAEKHENINIIHPNTIKIDDKLTNKGQYKYEICDFYQNDDMYFVKRGDPGKFVSAIEQAFITLSKIKNGKGKLKLPSGKILKPKSIHLLLILEDRVTEIERWEDIGSINFLLQLIDLHQSIADMDLSLFVDFTYEKKIR